MDVPVSANACGSEKASCLRHFHGGLPVDRSALKWCDLQLRVMVFVASSRWLLVTVEDRIEGSCGKAGPCWSMGERCDGSGANVDVSDPRASMDGRVLVSGPDTVSGGHHLPTVSALWKLAPGTFRRAVLICLAWRQGFPLRRPTASFIPTMAA